MNKGVGNNITPKAGEQASRLRDLVTEIVQCCQERTLFEAKTLGLPPAEVKALSCFRGQRYLTAKELAAEMEVGKSRATKVISGLSEKGLLETLTDPRDARVKLLSLTLVGRKKLCKIEEFVSLAHQKVLDQMDIHQRTNVLAALEVLNSSMQTVKEDLGLK